ncbi:MAG: LLM class flavin-dependent oxidoreductase [Actinomycetota bacterium]|nr:LLM class flavin-dependent oxidoreductase [Actinomycetota bacterium]
MNLAEVALGIAASSDEASVTDVAKVAQASGFATLWVNDTPMGDGIANASWILDATDLSAGIGVLSVDRRPIESFGDRVGSMASDRLVIGIGAGFSNDPIADTRRAVERARQNLECKIAVGAMGPKMCTLAGEIADVVLLNWMVPERIEWAKELIMRGAAKTGNAPTIAAYVRVAIDEGAEDRLEEEANRYANLPHYARHFDAMGIEPSRVGIACAASDVDDVLLPYREVLDQTIARALPASPSFEDMTRIIEAARRR